MLSNASLIFTRFSLPVLDDFTDKDNENIERIYKNVLMTTKSRAQQKALVKKYLGWVSRQPKKKVELFIFLFFLFFVLQFSFLFFFFSLTPMLFRATSEKIGGFGTWSRRYDLSNKSRENSGEI